MSDTTITDKQFVEAWIYAIKNKTGIRVMAEKLGIEYHQANTKASFMRRAGVCLPNMPHPNQKEDRETVDAKPLNELIKKELGEDAMGWRYRRLHG